jgi:hypothetical protein
MAGPSTLDSGCLHTRKTRLRLIAVKEVLDEGCLDLDAVACKRLSEAVDKRSRLLEKAIIGSHEAFQAGHKESKAWDEKNRKWWQEYEIGQEENDDLLDHGQ